MKEPEISIIMSVYNGQKYLKESIESILSQTFSNFEFIVVDDGSTDNSLEIIKEYTKKDKRIKLIQNNKNIGLTKSLNKTIKIAKGEFIARQDADDISLPNRLKKQLEFFKENKEYAVLGTNFYRISPEGKIIGRSCLPVDYDLIKKGMLGSNFFCHSTVMMKRVVLLKLGGYDEKYKYAQDSELWLRYIVNAYKMRNLEDYLLKSRPTQTSIGKRNRQAQIWASIKIRLKYYRYFFKYWRYNYMILFKFGRLILPGWLRKKSKNLAGDKYIQEM